MSFPEGVIPRYVARIWRITTGGSQTWLQSFCTTWPLKAKKFQVWNLFPTYPLIERTFYKIFFVTACLREGVKTAVQLSQESVFNVLTGVFPLRSSLVHSGASQSEIPITHRNFYYSRIILRSGTEERGDSTKEIGGVNCSCFDHWTIGMLKKS